MELPGAEQLQALVEEHLEVFLAATLQEHVPVRAYGLAGLLLGPLVVAQECGGTAAALPDGRDVGLDREREDDGVAVGAVVDGLLARCGEDALVGLHREGAQSGASQTAAVHAVLASCRGWGGTALRPQRSVGADQVNADGAGSVPGTAPARAGGSSSGVEQLREQVDTVGDD